MRFNDKLDAILHYHRLRVHMQNRAVRSTGVTWYIGQRFEPHVNYWMEYPIGQFVRGEGYPEWARKAAV